MTGFGLALSPFLLLLPFRAIFSHVPVFYFFVALPASATLSLLIPSMGFSFCFFAFSCSGVQWPLYGKSRTNNNQRRTRNNKTPTLDYATMVFFARKRNRGNTGGLQERGPQKTTRNHKKVQKLARGPPILASDSLAMRSTSFVAKKVQHDYYGSEPRKSQRNAKNQAPQRQKTEEKKKTSSGHRRMALLFSMGICSFLLQPSGFRRAP